MYVQYDYLAALGRVKIDSLGMKFKFDAEWFDADFFDFTFNVM